MTFKLPEGFSEDLHIWNYIPERKFTNEETDFILKAGKQFTADWHVHGSPLKAEVVVQNNAILSVVVDNDTASASGCSIDRSVAFVKQLEQHMGLMLMNRMKLLYSTEGNIHIGDHRKLEDLPAEALIFNHLSTKREDYLAEWLPAQESWLAPQLG